MFVLYPLLQDDSRSASTQQRSPTPSLHHLSPEQISKHSSLSLDLNANENSASEQSGSESIEDGKSTQPRAATGGCSNTCFYFALLFFPPVEERVGSSEVQGRLYLNKVFHISANKMFEMLFTNSNFFRRFMDIRKIMSKCQTCL